MRSIVQKIRIAAIGSFFIAASLPGSPSLGEVNRPGFNEFKETLIKYKGEQSEENIKIAYERFASFLNQLKPGMEKLSAITKNLNRGYIKRSGWEILSHTELGVMVGGGIEAGFGLHRHSLALRPHLRLGFSFSVYPEFLFFADSAIVVRSWDKRSSTGVSASPPSLSLTTSGKYFFIGGGMGEDYGKASESEFGVAFLFADKDGAKEVRGVGIPLPLPIPTSEGLTYFGLLQKRDKLIRAFKTIDLDQLEILTTRFLEQLDKLEAALENKWEGRSLTESLPDTDAFSSMVSMFHPLSGVPRHLALKGCGRMLSILFRGA